jgi:AbrB family looped-hinge helix DNA binding protein
VDAKLSSKGQIVIPQEIRKRLGLKPGDKVNIDMLEGRSAVIRPAAPPPKDVFFRAGDKTLGRILEEARKTDESKVRKLLESLGVTY